MYGIGVAIDTTKWKVSLGTSDDSSARINSPHAARSCRKGEARSCSTRDQPFVEAIETLACVKESETGILIDYRFDIE